MRLDGQYTLAVWVGAVTVLLAGGCDGASPEEEGLTRDSAGIEIVHSSPAASITWQTSEDPLVVLGAAAEDAPLYGVRDAVLLTDGTIAVANAGNHQVLVYSDRGRLLKILGGRGNGPGEFRAIRKVVLIGDTLAVYDARQNRVTLYDSYLEVSHTFPLSTNGGGLLEVIGVCEDRGLLARTRLQTTPATVAQGLTRPEESYYLLGGDGASIGELAKLPGPEEFGEIADEAFSVISPPFGRNPLAACGGNRFFYSANDSFEIEVRNTSGELIRIFRVDRPMEALTPALEQRVKRALMEDLPERYHTEINHVFEVVPRPPYLPPFSSILAERTGTVWVEDYHNLGTSDQPRRWSVFLPNGALEASLVLPPGHDLLAVAEERLVTRWTDTLGREYVSIFALHRE